MYIRLKRLHPKLSEAKPGDICQVSRQLGTRLIELGAATAATMEDTIGKRVVPETVPLAPVPIVLAVRPSETQERKTELSIKVAEPKKRSRRKRSKE